MERTKGKKAGNGSHRAEEAKDREVYVSAIIAMKLARFMC